MEGVNDNGYQKLQKTTYALGTLQPFHPTGMYNRSWNIVLGSNSSTGPNADNIRDSRQAQIGININAIPIPPADADDNIYCSNFGNNGAVEENKEAQVPPTMREQDMYVPIAKITRLMRCSLPLWGKITDEAKETIQECVSEFISFVTCEANQWCQQEHRKTITAEDVINAMGRLGLNDYVHPLSIFLARYRGARPEGPNKPRAGRLSLLSDTKGGEVDNDASAWAASYAPQNAGAGFGPLKVYSPVSPRQYVRYPHYRQPQPLPPSVLCPTDMRLYSIDDLDGPSAAADSSDTDSDTYEQIDFFNWKNRS